MSINLANVAREKGIRYFLISFTDLFGVVRFQVGANLRHFRYAKRWGRFCGLCGTSGYDSC